MYKGTDSFEHNEDANIGVLLCNLGSPDAPTAPALRRYLREFLSDPRVVEVPRLLWFLVLNLVILVIRPRRSAKLYRKVWRTDGSPLALITAEQAVKLEEQLAVHGSYAIEYGMRYGSHSIASALETLTRRGARKIIALPLYPQYSGATNGSTFDAIANELRQTRWVPDLNFVASYHDHPRYIDACAQHIAEYWKQHGRGEKLILSYHGTPQRYHDQGDPYFCQCQKTSRLIAEVLGIKADDCLTTFQSRFGREPWLQPYTDEVLRTLPDKGITAIQVFCPGFAADCLETLEEIDIQAREIFAEAGGTRFDYIPALNAESAHIDALACIALENSRGWPNDGETTAARSARSCRRSPASRTTEGRLDLAACCCLSWGWAA